MTKAVDPPKYAIDDETQEMLEAVLNMVAQTSTLQITDEGAEGLINLCDALAERFGIEGRDITIDSIQDAEGNSKLITVYERQPANDSKPKLKSIDGGLLNSTPPDDDDTRH